MAEAKAAGTRGAGWLIGIMAALLCGLGAEVASAQSQADAERLAAQRLTAAARGVLERAKAIDEPHAGLAAELLEMAVELDPGDTYAWHLRLEASELLGDPQAHQQLLRNYMRRHRRDDVAQLMLIDLLVREQPTVADRLETHRRLIEGDAAEALSPALRSRLAYRAAVLHREQGRLRDYGRQLQRALSLDEANPAAAVEALSFLRQQDGDRVEVMQALLTLLAADPGNSATHEQIADHLLRCGLYPQAAEWFDSVNYLWQVEGAPGEGASLQLVSDWILALWGAGDPQEATALLASFAQAYGVEDASDLPVGLQSLRIALLQAQSADDEAAAAFDDLRDTLQQRLDDDPESASRLADLAWAHLLFGYELDAVGPILQRLEPEMADDHPMMRRIRVWHAGRRGDADAARRMLRQAGRFSAVERKGLYLAEAEDLSRGERVEVLQQLAASAPERMTGAWAAQRLREMNARAQHDEACRTIARLVREIPPALREGAAVAGEMVELSAAAVGESLAYGQAVELDLQLANRAAVPLSLGHEGAVPAVVMLLPEVQVGEDEPEVMQPQFVDLARRLRLQPAEELGVRVRLDQPDLLRLLEANPSERVSISVLAVLNPRITADGSFQAGMFGDAAEVDAGVRTAVSLHERSMEAMIERLADADAPPARRLSAAGRLIALADAAAQADRDDLVPPAADALADAFGQMTAPQRVVVLGYLMRRDALHAIFSDVMEQARADDDVRVQAMLLSGGDAAADATALEAGLEREGEEIQRIAQRVLQIRDARQPREGAPPEQGAGQK